jgi:tRNA (Thr-GGU) A37 N-methylase
MKVGEVHYFGRNADSIGSGEKCRRNNTARSMYIQGIKDLDGFSHLILIYHFHKIHRFSAGDPHFNELNE